MAQSRLGAPIKIGGFNVTEPFRFTGTEKEKICWDEIVALEPDDVTDSNILPLYRTEGGIWSQHFGATRIEVCVRLMSFLTRESKNRTSNGRKDRRRTRSSWNSLKAEARRTMESGTIVVHLLVGETPGIC